MRVLSLSIDGRAEPGAGSPEEVERVISCAPAETIEFPGESHGFRKAETNVRAREAELAFYGQVFGFKPAGPEVPLAIDNLAATAR